uniref:Calmodulin n=1 Tax=Strombidium rassoulzadegani TaxID=1082188 RepID=A0A7S3FYP0_9SPIT|mmetsp:Transcript_2937/g.4984  ORF Transcript_2937/g.4984 Transcript_2937/m.4984 type:complete len:151 (+) Transcript_2937:26-478(+)
MMSGNLTDEQVHEFKGVFAYFGLTGDTPIDKKEINIVMRSLGQNPTDQELQEIMEIIERDGNPPITFPYFLSLLAAKMQDQDAEQQLIHAFDVYDKEKDGRIGSDDFRSVIDNLGEKLTENEIKEIIDEADVDGDGHIDYMEFVKMMMSK